LASPDGSKWLAIEVALLDLIDLASSYGQTMGVSHVTMLIMTMHIHMAAKKALSIPTSAQYLVDAGS
jgi:uncharacterized membrane protein YqgA involved in biofilm formation